MISLSGTSQTGTIQLGVVNSYDPVTMTAEVTTFDGSARYQNVGMAMSSCDLGNGTYSYTPPSIGAPCVFTKVSGEVLILAQYAPPNLGANDDIDSCIGSTINRSTTEMPNKEHLPGNWIISSQSGVEVFLRDMVFSIQMSPIFYSTWNLMNSIWDTMCNIFRFSAPAADVLVDVNNNSDTNIDIKVRKNASERDGVPAINLLLGKNADVIKLKINGQEFCHVDLERNVTFKFKKAIFEGDEVNMENVQSVYLP